MGTPMELIIDLGAMPVDAHQDMLMEGLRELLEKSELCDVELIAGGQIFLAHRPVLAAVSPSFHECLLRLSAMQDQALPPPGGASPDQQRKLSLTLSDITHPEAVQAMLDCIYGPPAPPAGGTGDAESYNPGSVAANRDVLRLAQRFQVLQLQYKAS